MCTQIILAFGNYVNSTKRGCAYGFKLQSLDMVILCFYAFSCFVLLVFKICTCGMVDVAKSSFCECRQQQIMKHVVDM